MRRDDIDDPMRPAEGFKNAIIYGCIAWTVISLGLIALVSLPSYGDYEEFPPRTMKNVYKTIPVPRWESTVCYECHN
jgi:hypothetical protein